MTILNNSATALSLGELNKNINKLGKALAKVSTGQRITGASDDSASFAISEKMREQIRSLEQDIQNVQNGSSMLKTAHGGIENIVDELRSLKELAINAANDSNTDADRAIMQKEFDQRRATIDEIANWTTYNEKVLLDGTYARNWKYEEYVVNDLVVNTTTGSVTKKGDGPPKSLNGVYNLVNNFYAAYQTTEGSQWYPRSPEVYGIRVDKSFGASSGSNFSYTNNSTSSQGIQGAVVMDFSAATILGELPKALNDQGFCITCGGCSQYINIKFNSNISASESTYQNPYGDTESRQSYEPNPVQFVIGVKDVKDISQLPKAIFDGISNAKVEGTNLDENTDNNVLVDAQHELRLAKDPSNSNRYIFLKESSSYLNIQFMNRLIISETSGEEEEEVEEPEEPEEPQEVQTVSYMYNDGNPLWIQHGTRANQRINVYIDSMKTSAMQAKVFDVEGGFISEADEQRYNDLSNDSEKQGAFLSLLHEADRKTLDQVSVRNQHDANIAIRVIDGVLDYALDEATNMGAYLQRLEYTEANVTTQDENVQAAESTIRDADMAKEMTEYTKQNVLSQAAQSMLAQANQSFSSVLGLLQ